MDLKIPDTFLNAQEKRSPRRTDSEFTRIQHETIARSSMAVEKPRHDALAMQKMMYRSHGFKAPHRNMTPLENRAQPLMDASRDISTRGSVLKEPR